MYMLFYFFKVFLIGCIGLRWCRSCCEDDWISEHTKEVSYSGFHLHLDLLCCVWNCALRMTAHTSK